MALSASVGDTPVVILVTGATGLLGGWLVAKLEAEGRAFVGLWVAGRGGLVLNRECGAVF